MLLHVDPADPRPVFRQIVEEIERCVAVGVLKTGDPLPAIRSLADELSINPNTVQHAYKTLEQGGVVEVRRGLGTFVLPARSKDSGRQKMLARQIAERMLREAYRHGLLASDLMAALEEIDPRRAAAGSGPGGQEQV
jgi:GntR family transcriptional regulator